MTHGMHFGGESIPFQRPICFFVRSTRGIAALVIALCVITGIFLAPYPLQAQVGTGDILGTVTDSTGAVLPGAKVIIKNTNTGEQRVSATNGKGEYVFSTLQNGTYKLTVEMAGFKSYSVAGLQLSTGDRARFDASLTTGAVTETVQVTGEAAALQTDSSEVSSTIDSNVVQDLPLNNRQFVTALRIQPGITAGAQGGKSSSGSPSDRRDDATIVANGQSSALNNQMIDGFDNNERLNGLIGLQPSIDGIQEVKTDTSSYRAENGRTAGAVINVITKAGTNSFHGSAYDYFRNDILDAPDYGFGKTMKKAKYRQNNFGGSIGGPIWKDRTFFFFDLEETRVIKGKTYNTFVPTAYERANPGDFSDYGGPVVPQEALSPLMLKYFSLFPLSQDDTSTPGLGKRTDSPSNVVNGRVWDLRIDHHFNSNNLLFARYASNPVTTEVNEPWPVIAQGGPYSADAIANFSGIYPGGSGIGFPGPSSTKSQNFQMDFLHIFSSALLVDVKAGFTRVNIQTLPENYGKGASDKLGIPNAHIADLPQTDGLMGVGGPTFEWSFLGDSNSIPQVNINNSFQYAGSLTYTRGSHTFKVGAGFTQRQLNPWSDDFIAGFFVFAPTPPYFDDRANFLTGHAVGALRGDALIRPAYRTNEFYGYAQDDWRITPKLTLNLGLRYDVFSPFSEKHGFYANYVPATETFIQGTQNKHIGVATDYSNIAPRFGFAYSLDNKTVVRGAFGISFFPPDVGMVSGGGGAAPISVVQNPNPGYVYEYNSFGPQIFSNQLTGPPVPTKDVDISNGSWKSNPGVTLVSAKSPGLSSAYAEQFNLGVQREIGNNTLSLNYVGVMGHQLLRAINAQNPGPSGAGQATKSYLYPDLYLASNNCGTPNPATGACLGTINYVNNGSVSNYNAMQLIYARHATKGLSVNANYTWAHGLEATGNTVPADVHADYGNSGSDIRQRVAINASYELPFAKNAKGLTAILLKDWQVNTLYYWQTGLPFSVDSRATASNGLAYINEPGVTTDRPSYEPGKVARSNGSVNKWINTDAFHPQTQGTVSNQAPNQFRGPRDRKDDLSITKTFPIYREMKMEFRAEAFNISNTPNFNIGSNTTVGAWCTAADVTSGLCTTTDVPNMNGQLLGTITDTSANDDPRQFQFALKLKF